MSGLMEILAQLNSSPEGFETAIVPTILLPLAFLSTGISVVATFIAGLFGVKLKAEGPKKLLEVLLKPKVLISAAVLNAVIYGGMQGYQYVKNGPVPFFIQNFKNGNTALNIEADTTDKDLHWKQNLEEGIFTEGEIVGDELYAGSKDGNLFVMDLKSGKLKNKIFFGKFMSPKPILYKGHLYFGEGLHHSHHMRVYKFDPKSKKVVAHFETKGHTEMMAVTATVENEDYLFASAGGDGLYALNPHTMEKRWQLNEGHMDSYPSISGDFLYIGTGVPTEDIGVKRPYAMKVSIKTGEIVWKKELPLSTWFAPIVADNNVCFPMGELHVKSDLGGIHCLDLDGNRGRSFLIEKPIIGKQISYKQNIVFNDYKGTLYSWNLSTGILNWKIERPTKKYGFSSSRQLAGDKYLFFNRDGNGIVYNIDSGKVLKEFTFNDKETTFADPIVHENGVVAFGLKGTVKYYKSSSFN
ncbi:MAG: hypothetical protein EP319_15835 [Deltaproteobacteria bacterium]|nr:MAG: hypothetical protein EP319_15835 [Deltaproteobacteria bacterium]